MAVSKSSLLSRLALLALLAPLAPLGGACASGTVPLEDGGQAPGNDPQSEEPAICLLHNCESDAECGACSDGRHSCKLDERRCVACDADTGAGCGDSEYCSSYGVCVPDGVSCPTDVHGTPTITCASSADCIACDPMHRVCDPATSQCVACTADDTSECQSTDVCDLGHCSAKCPSSCSTDNDCGDCGGPGHEAHACNAHKCAQCSSTYACPAGEECSAQGVCVAQCGGDGAGTCQSDADCASCGGEATKCHMAINESVGQCGPAAAGCSDLGEGVAVLPPPWDQVTNLCSNDGDCAGVGVELNVGKMLRDLTGFDQIGDADITYGMNVCADVTVGSGNDKVSCGVCVPCQVDSDCNNIDIDQVAGDAFGPIGSLAAAFLLDQVFGANDHTVHMYCETVAAGYGVCTPCPGILYDCGVGGGDGGGSSGGSGGTCDHDTCSTGAALSGSCDACAAEVCAVDDYCCTTAWDATCVQEVDAYCNTSCGGGGGQQASCDHSECDTGASLDAACSDCAAAVCAADSYCCDNQWDGTCVQEVDQYCNLSCGGGGGGQPECSQAADCPGTDGCLAGGTCGPCSDDADCYPWLCDSYWGECY